MSDVDTHQQQLPDVAMRTGTLTVPVRRFSDSIVLLASTALLAAGSTYTNRKSNHHLVATKDRNSNQTFNGIIV